MASSIPVTVTPSGYLLLEERENKAAPANIEIREDLLEALMAAPSVASAPKAKPTPAVQTIRKESVVYDRLPRGVNDEAVLLRLAERGLKITGLVVAIDVRSGGPLDGQPGRVRDLLGPEDFACQAADELLLVFPEHQGASAQRKLSDLSQKLWDLQLQSLDTTLAPVSWGAVEVKDEPVGESRASASERMHETKRSRRDFNRARAFESV